MNPLCFIDLETTGLQIGADRIISIAAMRRDNVTPLYELVNPERPIPAEVSELTGLTDAMVENAPRWDAIAQRVAHYIEGCTLVGFNIHNFDLPMLAEEMHRVGVAFDWEAFTVIDCGSIFKKKEERTLAAALEFYCGKPMIDAHNAMADVVATADVFDGQLRAYVDLRKLSQWELAMFSQLGDKRADPSGKLVWKDGKVCYNFGKHKGTAVTDEQGFALWMLNRDFPETTKRVLTRILDAEAGLPV
jgi:DNA polymerase-3 subunit epsilon